MEKKTLGERLQPLPDALQNWRRSLRLLFFQWDQFADPTAKAGHWNENANPELMARLERLAELLVAALSKNESPADLSRRNDWNEALEILNSLVLLLHGNTLTEALENAFFEALNDFHLDLAELLRPQRRDGKLLQFYLDHARCVVAGVGLLRTLLVALREEETPGTLSPLNPLLEPVLTGCSSVLDASPEKLVAVAMLRDRFSRSRVFCYNGEQFQEADLNVIRPAEKFFGFHAPRDVFLEQLGAFSRGEKTVPLLVSSLPGLGKTQMSIAHTLHFANLTLIMAEPESLSDGLDRLLRQLERRRQRRFVVFFDDIDTRTINWYEFRTHVGGSLALPENVTFVLASNYEFPANILSRGRGLTFPMFDELRCQEMIEDFLLDFGMRNINNDLAAVIGSNYLEEFSQKKFSELSPRTLMRYLEHYRNDDALRRKMLLTSQQEMTVRPDAQVFYEFNVRLLKTLYGKEYLDSMLEDRLKSL